MDAAFLPWLRIAALLLVLTGVAGTVLPLLPGVPLVFAGLWLGAWIDGYQNVSSWTVAVLGALTVLSLLVDFAATALGAKRVGASPKAIAGAAAGTVVGLFFGLPGLILGPFVGAVAGELAARNDLERATAVGVATWVGLLLGTLAKLALVFAMIGIFIAAYLL